MSNLTNGSSPEGVSIPAFYYPTQIFFTSLFNHATLLDFVALDRAHPNQTPNAVLILQPNSHPFNLMSPCICNAMHHCMLYHATCIMNATRAAQSTPLTGCHRQSHHLHMTSIHHFIQVNILWTHISTSTYNMSFYVQVMTHTQSSHLMTICSYKLITCQYIRTHILTTKHVTLSQAMTLSNKSYNVPKSSHKQSQN